MSKVRVAFLGPGRIVQRVMTGFGKTKNCVLTAIASRTLERARQAAVQYGAEYAFGSYEELAASDQADLIYIATPHPFHKEQAILCMEHGKHVLCEKPFALNAREASEMIDCAARNGVFLMEAMWTRFMPAAMALKERVLSGEIGDIRHISADFAFSAPFDPESRLFSPALAGGALMDVGVYAYSACSMLLGPSPDQVQSLCVKAPSGVDERMTVQMHYPSGATAQWMCGTDADGESREMILGSKGRAIVPDFWHPTSFSIVPNGGQAKEYRFEPENEGHHHQFDHAAACIQAGLRQSPVMPLSETLAMMEMLTRIRLENGIVYPGEKF